MQTFEKWLSNGVVDSLAYCLISVSHCDEKLKNLFQAKTPEQWEASEGQISKSPPCLGGAGK